jgi:hypothetical protein
VAVSGAGLVSSPPSGPGQQYVDAVFAGEQERVEQAAELIVGQLDHPWWC